MYYVKICSKCGSEWPVDEKIRKTEKKLVPLKFCTCGADSKYIVNKEI